MATASLITLAEMVAYRATAHRRQEREQQELVQRQEVALGLDAVPPPASKHNLVLSA